MRPPPPLSEAIRYPITVGVAVLAIVATLRWWSGADIAPFTFGVARWWSEPWRFFAPVLFHADLIHLLFNLLWLWLFGTKVESEFGHARTLGIFAFLAAGSTAAESALFHGGVGLSGVNYGLFGALWTLSRTDRRFSDSIDRQTVQLLVGWFFLCIALTVMGVWQVANAAHGAGLLLGALLGWTIAARNQLDRLRNGSILGVVFLLCIIGGTVARPYVNLTDDIGEQLAYLGYVALEEGDELKAVDLLQKAIATNSNVPDWWHNLGVAYYRLGQMQSANHAFERETALKKQLPDNEE